MNPIKGIERMVLVFSVVLLMLMNPIKGIESQTNSNAHSHAHHENPIKGIERLKLQELAAHAVAASEPYKGN